MMRKEYSFTLTDEQIQAIDQLNGFGYLMFSENGSVQIMEWDEYEVTIHTVYKDGDILRESRGLDSDGWETEDEE